MKRYDLVYYMHVFMKIMSISPTMSKIQVVVTCVLCALIVEGLVERDGSRLVHTEQGPVRGYKDSDGDIIEFYNIPYATVPTGINKFKAPLPPPVWTEPFEAIDKRVICPQNVVGQWLGPNLVVQENCLIANVYMRDTDEKNLPVLVIVHGGGFVVGFGNWKKPKNLIRTRNMIVVTFNYRLSIHGFLCLGTDIAPGNAGMKDQVALLRWVKYNIASFGGNPDDVTISGYSAGSASVDLLMLSKSARGLFNKVIPESGSHLSPFAVQVDPMENAKYFARRHNITNVNDVSDLESFYTSASFEILTEDMFDGRTDNTFVFVPCVERDIGQEAFLNDSPFNILKTGNYEKVPMLHGFANMEGIMRVNIFDTWRNKMNDKFSDFLPVDLQFESEEQRDQVANTIKEFYFGDEPVSNNNILGYVDYFTDTMFAYSTLRSLKMLADSGHDQIYLYEYSFVDDDIPFVPHTNVRGAEHSAQTTAVLDGRNMSYSFDESDLTEEYKTMKSTIRYLWSNFIYDAMPVAEGSSLPAWPPVNATWSPHMSLALTVELRGSLIDTRMRFWDDIYERHYRIPVPPNVTDSAPSHKNVWLINLLLFSILLSWK